MHSARPLTALRRNEPRACLVNCAILDLGIPSIQMQVLFVLTVSTLSYTMRKYLVHIIPCHLHSMHVSASFIPLIFHAQIVFATEHVCVELL